MQDERFETAVKKLEKLQSRYPYGRYAQQAQMEIAYAYYKQGEPAPALSTLDRFIKQYPNNPRLDYVFFLKGLINFDETMDTAYVRLFAQNPAERDPQSMRDSFDAFKELVSRFPDSKYAPEARIRMQYLVNSLAASDINTARYYLRRGAYQAAANRAQAVITDFPNSPQTRDALDIMVRAYAAMGLHDLSADTKRVLDLNVAKDGIPPSQPKAAPWWQFWNG